MTSDAHLHNAAATLREILARRQPEYRWHVEVLPRRDEPSSARSVGPADRTPTPRPTDGGRGGGSEDDAT